MANKTISWQTKLFNKTPFYVTLAGYIFGIGILLGAASTWFIESTIYCQGSAVIHPSKDIVIYPEEIVLLNWKAQSGQKIEKGIPIAEIISDPKEVATYKLRHHLSSAIKDSEDIGGGKTDNRLDELKILLDDVEKTSISDLSIAPSPGWLEDVVQGKNTNGKPNGLLEKGTTLFSVANLEEVILEISVPATRVPTVLVGDEVSLLLADWDNEYLHGEVKSIQTILSFSVPITFFETRELEVLGKGTSSTLEVLLEQIECTLNILEEVVRFEIKTDEIRPSSLQQIKSGASFKFSFPSLNGKKMKTKWEAISVSFTVKIPKTAYTDLIEKNLEENLDAGISTISVSKCWIEVGQQKLFQRLFSK